MKLAIITPVFYPSQTGYSFAFQGLCNSLLNSKKVEQITIYNDSPLTGEEGEFNDKVRVKSLMFKGINRLFNIFPGWLSIALVQCIFYYKLKRMYKELNEFDLILIETAERGWLSFLLDKNLNSPVVTRLHGAFPEAAVYFSKDVPYGKSYFDLLLKTKNIATTTYHYIDFIKNYCKDYTILRNKKFFILPNTNAVEVDKVDLKKVSGKLKILQLGRMDQRGYFYKGFNDSIQALMLLEERSKKIAGNIQYTVIGSGELEPYFINNANKLNEVEFCHYPQVDNLEVKRMVEESDVILMPSRNEGMSMFVVECIQMGKPFIFTEGDNGLRDVLIDEFNGLSIEPFNYVNITDAIERYSLDADLVSTHAANSRAHYCQNYSSRKISEFFSVIDKMLL